MSILTAAINPQATTTLAHALFHLTFVHTNRQTKIRMQFHTSLFNTRYYPQTHNILQQEHPRVLRTKCFNDKNLPFTQEVKKTELAHLFEHILLENLCQLRLAAGHTKAKFSGVTKWDWTKDKEGLFHITISAGTDIAPIFPLALQKTITLFTHIMQSDVAISAPAYHPSPTYQALLHI